MVVWVPCVLIGVWATGLVPPTLSTSAVLSVMLKNLVGNPVLSGLLTAGVLAAIMSSLDSQFLCMGTIFTNDIVLHRAAPGRFSDRQIVLISRIFIVAIVAVTYGLAMVALAKNVNIFDLAVWSFSGFSTLFPLVVAALYWRRVTKAGAYAAVVAGMAVWFWFFWCSGFGGEYTVSLGSWRGIMPVTLSFAASAVAIVGVSLATRPPSQKTLDQFFRA
jgi:SSS family solute:Na+ symporter